MFRTISSLSRITRLGLCCGLLSLAPVPTISASGRGTTRPAQAPAPAPESASSLQAQLESILRIASDKKSKQIDDLVNDLQIPESANWFSTAFGEELGPTLADTYKSSWKDYAELVVRMFRENPWGKHFQVFLKEYSPSSPVPNDSFIQAILQNSKTPLKLYTASVGKDRPIGTLPGIYTYSQGAFRVVNWRTFYGLPNVKPVRIRVDTATAMNQLIRHVNPVRSAEARQEHLHGTVVLHVVIDRDGSVLRADPVSGPAELTKESVD